MKKTKAVEEILSRNIFFLIFASLRMLYSLRNKPGQAVTTSSGDLPAFPAMQGT